MIIGPAIDLVLDQDDDPNQGTEEVAATVEDPEVDHVIEKDRVATVQDLKNQEKTENDREVETENEVKEVEVEIVKKKQGGKIEINQCLKRDMIIKCLDETLES